ncbi:MAG: helix-turn-helix transcriptional regulator [Clostridia bacterium]|nr:helix-turn-helix transcriptional regulator [Clostridia bacterium]
MNFGEKFTQLVCGSNLSRRKLAQKLGFGSPGSIDYYMKHDKLPSGEILSRICDCFGVTSEYFGMTTQKSAASAVLKQDELKYVSPQNPIPILSDETESAIQTGMLNLSGIGIHCGFAIAVDDRLSALGFPPGSTLYLSTKFNIETLDVAIVRMGNEQFFATCQKHGTSMVILPLDRTRPPVTADMNGKEFEIIASLENIFVKPSLVNLRR